MRHLPILALALCSASPALADAAPHPHLNSATPRIAPADPGRSPGFIFYGSDLEPTPAQAATNQYYINTHASEFYQLELQVETDAGLQTPVLCTNAPGSFQQGCVINAAGPGELVIQVNYLTLPGWRDGLKLYARAHVTLPWGYKGVSNTLVVPFARSQTAPVITAQSKTTYNADQSDWGLRLAATGLDNTANARIDGNAFTDATIVVGESGKGTAILTLPPAARSGGHHTVQLCDWALDNGGPGERASCSAPVSYSVVMEFHRMQGAAGLIPLPAQRAGMLSVPHN